MISRYPLLLAAVIGVAALQAPAGADPGSRDQDAALKGRQAGRILPLPAIEALIVPRMRGFAYLGPEFYPESVRYRLKFLRGPQVVWIDVDGRTGQIIGRSGS